MRAVALALALALLAAAPAHAFKPFRAMFKAAKDERSYRDQAQDDRLALQLKQNLLLADPSGLFSVSAHVYMGHAFLVGTVKDQAQAESLMNMARGMDGIVSVDGYLVPEAPKQQGPESGHDNSTAEQDDPGFVLGMAVNHALRQDPNVGNGRFTAKVVDGTVVLMGVAKDEAERQAAVQAASSVQGIKGVKDFILLPEAGTGKRFHILN